VQSRVGTQDKVITLREAKHALRTASFRLAASDAAAFIVDVGRDRARSIKFRFNKLNSA
jgi:hypothetical protein